MEAFAQGFKSNFSKSIFVFLYILSESFLKGRWYIYFKNQFDENDKSKNH